MAGISHVLNIAKEALLAHQLSVQVASHNIANVDTPGYTRQTLSLTPQQATPTAVGSLGGGVKGDAIARQYDTFMTQRLMTQSSTMGNLEAQKESLRIVETIFNEAPGLALNDLLSQFWSAWQDLSDNPELLAARQTVVQKGELLAEQLQGMNNEIVRTRYDIGLSLDTAIDDVNSLARQIAEINVSITSSEDQNKKANDLRDQRDELVKKLSELLDVNYFENKTGAYTVILEDGHSLVDTNEAWQVEWKDNSLYWVSTGKDGQPVRAELGSGAELGGKIGGWLQVRGQLVEGDPDNILGRLDAFANALVREVNQQHTQGVGISLFSGEVLGAETAANTTILTAQLDAASATADIIAGTLEINGRSIGAIDGAAAVNGLATAKTANAAAAINDALSGVTARLTTLTAGSGAVDASSAADGDVITFSVNGAAISYTVDKSGAPDDSDPAVFAVNLVAKINTDIATYNASATTSPKITIQAVRGDGTNGGGLNTIVLRNTIAGDESRIEIGGLDTSEADITGLINGSFEADAVHNTGELSLFADGPITVQAGANDTYLDQLGMGGGLHAQDRPDDGELTFSYTDGGVEASLQGFRYSDQLQTDGGSFDIWLYNADGSLSLPQPITVSLERATSLNDVATAINIAAQNSGAQSGWLSASVVQNKLSIKLDNDHQLAFANDSSNFLQVAGLNTFFSGYSAGTFQVNDTVAEDLTLLAAGTIGDHGEFYRGDNSNALLITNIQRDEYVAFTGGGTDTLDGFYNALVADIGNQGRSINRDHEYTTLVTNQLQEMRDAVSGVSLDEEMANLIKYQHAYSAAAKLISTSDEMLQTLLHSVGI